MTYCQYFPLHSAPAGIKFGRYVGDMAVTNRVSDTLVRLPIFYDISDKQLDKVIGVATKFLGRL